MSLFKGTNHACYSLLGPYSQGVVISLEPGEIIEGRGDSINGTPEVHINAAHKTTQENNELDGCSFHHR